MSLPLFRLGMSKNGVRRIRALLEDVSWLLEEWRELREPAEDSKKLRAKLSKLRCRVEDLKKIMDWPDEQYEENEEKSLVSLILLKVKRKNEEKRIANWEMMIKRRNKTISR